MSKSGQSVKQRIYNATNEFLVVTLYLWAIFSLFALYRSVLLAEGHVAIEQKGFALINALVLAKIIVIAKEFHFGEWFDDFPLIYSTLTKSASFSVLLACFKVIEEAAVGMYHGKSSQNSLAGLGGGTWQGILCLTFLLFVVLIPFFGLTELESVLGESNLIKVFFRSRELPQELKASPGF